MAVAGEIVEDAEDVVLGVAEAGVGRALFVYLLQNGDDHLLIYGGTHLSQRMLPTNEREDVAVETVAYLGVEVGVDALG